MHESAVVSQDGARATANQNPTTAVPPALQQLWEEFKRSASREVRDKLIVHYAPLVKYVAGRVAAGLPRHVEQGDLVSYGVIGLIDAIDRFDPARGVKFETYGIPRIKGAILDELRAIDWVPRSVRSKAKAVEQAYAKLEADLLRTPSDAEVAAEMGISESELAAVLRQISFVGVAALDQVLAGHGDRLDNTTLGETIADQSAGPVAIVELKEARRLLADAVTRLGERERAVLTLYYYEGLTLSEIGQIFGVSESRVCQIHTKAVLQLRAKMTITRSDGSDLRTDLLGHSA